MVLLILATGSSMHHLCSPARYEDRPADDENRRVLPAYRDVLRHGLGPRRRQHLWCFGVRPKVPTFLRHHARQPPGRYHVEAFEYL